jgi:glutaryl-CoA dehydrogenase
VLPESAHEPPGFSCLRRERAAEALPDGFAGEPSFVNVRKAKEVSSTARDILGGNGLLLDYYVRRHLPHMEVVDTYDGTDTIQSLIVGRDVTGISAFA